MEGAKHSGFESPVYGRIVQDDEEIITLPDGLGKLVKKYTLEKHYSEMSPMSQDRPAQIPIRKNRLIYLLNEYTPNESDRWIMFSHPNHFLIYDMKTRFCIFDAEYIDYEDHYPDQEPICAVITRIVINQDPNQHPSDIEEDFLVISDLLTKDL
jgi:hypothetical protein